MTVKTIVELSQEEKTVFQRFAEFCDNQACETCHFRNLCKESFKEGHYANGFFEEILDITEEAVG